MLNSKNFIGRLVLGVAAIALVSTSVACTAGVGARIQPSSHFIYPNSNVKELGPVKVSMFGGWSLFMPSPIRTSDIDHKLYNKALAQHEGADMIIDYVVTSEMKFIPLYMVMIYYTTHELEGMAASAEIGRQHLD